MPFTNKLSNNQLIHTLQTHHRGLPLYVTVNGYTLSLEGSMVVHVTLCPDCAEDGWLELRIIDPTVKTPPLPTFPLPDPR